MTRGGKRAGAGRPSKAIASRAMANLSEVDAARLQRLMVERRESASDVLRAGLVALEATRPRADASTA